MNGFPPYSEIVNTDSILSELTEEEYHEAVRNAIPIESLMVEPTETQPEGNIKPMANMSWAFDNLQPPGPSGGPTSQVNSLLQQLNSRLLLFSGLLIVTNPPSELYTR